MSTEMEKAAETVGQQVVLELDPDDILIPEESNVRLYSTLRPETDEEREALERLGVSIAKYQLQPVLVTPNVNLGGPRYSLIAGRRRLKAVKMYNLGADHTIKIKAVVDTEVKQDKKKAQVMFMHALHENVHRKNINPLDFAYDCRMVRDKFGDAGKGAKGTQKIAELFGVSPATVTQAEKLLSLPEDLQVMVARGELSAEAAQETVKHGKTEEQRKEIVEKAKEKQDREEREGPPVVVVADDIMGGGVVSDEPPAEVEGGVTERKARKRKNKAVSTKHVRAAAREVTGQNTKRSRTELLDFFRGQLGPTNGFPNGSIHLFCDGLLSWAEGKVSDKKLNALWDDMVQNSFRGKAEPKKEAVAAGKKGAAGKPAPKKKAAKTKPKK